MLFFGLKKSDKPDKKYFVELAKSADSRRKRIYFGDSHMKDYTLHNALERDERRRAYINRHRSREDWTNPETPGFWSRWILWGDTPSVQTNLRRTLAKFHLQSVS